MSGSKVLPDTGIWGGRGPGAGDRGKNTFIYQTLMPPGFLKTRQDKRIQVVLLTSLTQLDELAVHNLCFLFMDCRAACESLAKEMPLASGLTLSLLLRGNPTQRS